MPIESVANDPSGRQDPPPEALDQGAAEMKQALRRQPTQTPPREDAEHRPDRASALAELRYFSSLLKKLLDFIARSEDESVSRVVAVIRSGASYNEINEILSVVNQELPPVQGSSEDGRETASGASQ